MGPLYPYDRGILYLYQQQTGNGMSIFVLHHFVLDILCEFTLHLMQMFSKVLLGQKIFIQIRQPARIVFSSDHY